MTDIIRCISNFSESKKKHPKINNTSRIKSMQKIINVLALSSFVVSAAIVGGGVYVYQNRESITENVKSQVMEGVAGAIQDQIGDLGSLGGFGGGSSSSPVPSTGTATPAPIPGLSLPF